MNKYNIEVGDTITIINDWKVARVTSTGVWFDETNGNEKSWSRINNDIDTGHWKLTKMNKGKIIAYTLLKDTIEYKKGDIFKKQDFDECWHNQTTIQEYPIWYEDKDVAKTEWFSPIYEEVKPSEVYVDTLAGKVKVTKTKLMIEGEKPLTVASFLVLASNLKLDKRFDGYQFTVETFKVGCKTFHVSDISKIEEAIKQVS